MTSSPKMRWRGSTTRQGGSTRLTPRRSALSERGLATTHCCRERLASGQRSNATAEYEFCNLEEPSRRVRWDHRTATAFSSGPGVSSMRGVRQQPTTGVGSPAMALDITHTRLRNQRLSAGRFAGPEDVVRWLGAVQAQDYAGAKWALGLRM